MPADGNTPATCTRCEGQGYTTEHDPGCWGGSSCERLCPVQARCNVCHGEGVILPAPPLLPMVWRLGDFELHHGERGTDEDPDHPGACFCGAPDYLTCPGYLDDPGMAGLVLHPTEDDADVPF